MSAAQSPYKEVYRPRFASNSSCVPCSTIRPCSRTTIRSASRIVDSRWAMMKAVRPESRSLSARSSLRSVPMSIDEERARQRDELPLSEREARPAFLQLCLVAVFEAHDEVVRADRLCGLHDL